MSDARETPDLAEFVRQRTEQDETTVANYFAERVRQEAARYADHPDYREEWRP